MKTKIIVTLMTLCCFVCFGMPDHKGTPYGTGIAQAEDDENHALRLMRDLEDALKTGDQERIRLAHQRVNSHQMAARMLTQRPLMQRQLQAATQVSSRELNTQAVVPAASRTETLTKQTKSLESPAGLASASGFQGTASGMKQATQPLSGQVQGMSKEGIQNFGSRAEGVSSSPAAGMGSAGMQGFSSKPEGVSKDIGAGVSSLSVRGVATETARGFDSKEHGVNTFQNTEKTVGTAAGAASTRFIPDVPDPPSLSGRQATSRSSTPVRRTPAVQAATSPAFAAPAPAAASSPVTPDVISRTPSGYKPPSAASQQAPVLDRAISSSRSPEAPRSMASPEIIGRGPGGTGVIVPPRVRDGSDTAAGPPAFRSSEAPRSTASPEIIGRGPGGTGVIVPPGVKEGANTLAGPLVPGPARPSTSGSGGSPFYTQEGSPDVIKVKPPTTGSGTGGSTSQEMLNIHNLAQQLRPTPPDPQQVKQWSDSIRRPGSSEPPKQIEKFSGGDPSWSEINRRVTAASDPLYSRDRTVPVRDPDLARLANREQNYTKGTVDPELARLTGKEPRPPTTTERMDAYSQAQQQAAQRRENLVDALRSGNQEQINRAALQVRQDPLAVKQANISELPEMRTRMNEPMANIQRSMEPGIREQIARQYGVKPNEVEVAYTSNPAKGPKVHQDADVTVRVRGMDVPADKVRPIVNEQFQRAATEATGGGRATTGMSPDKLAERSYIETTDRLHRHAFGSSRAEGDQIIHGPKSQPIRDVRQVTGAMEDKFNVARNQADGLTRQGRLPEAEVQRGLAMDQTVKSFDGQVRPRVEAMGGRVPEHVQKGMDIMRGVKEGRISPAQAEMELSRLGPRGETPESMTQKATGLLEAGQNLQGPGRGRVPDRVANETFVQNVKDRMELNRLERAASGDGQGPGGGKSPASPTDTGAFRPVSGQTPLPEGGRSSFQEQTLTERAVGYGRNKVEDIQDADKALGRRLGIGQLPADASGLRAGANTAGGAALGALAAYGSYQAGQGVGDNIREGYLDRDMAAQYRADAQTARQQGNEKAASILERTAEDLDKRGAEKYQAAATDAAVFGGTLAVGAAAAAVAPTATALYGGYRLGQASYDKTRELLETTETGRMIDKGTENLMDRGMQAGEALADNVGGLLGGQTQFDRDRAQMTGRQASYDRALERGAITLQDGVTREDLMDYLKNRNPAPSEKDGYTAADYQAGLNELISKTPRDPASATPAVPQTGTETAGTVPGKSRQELDLEAYQALQAIKDLQKNQNKDKEEGSTDKQTASTDEPEKEPVKPEEDPNKDNQNAAGGGSDTAGGTPNQGGDPSAGTTDTAVDQNTTEVTDPNLVSRLQAAENQTGGGRIPGADPAGLQVAMNTNVTGSMQQNVDQQNLQGSQQALGSMGGTQAERAAAAQNQQMLSQSQVTAQGQQTTQAIIAGGQEYTAAQQNLQTSRQGSLGNILLGSLMGGLTSGAAVGIDRLAGGIGSGAGQQVSANWGIQPPPPPPPPPTTVTPTTTGTGSTGSQMTGGQTVSIPQAPVQTASTTSGGSTTTISRPPATTTIATGGVKTCRVAGTCSFTKYGDSNGCCKVCGKKVATIRK